MRPCYPVLGAFLMVAMLARAAQTANDGAQPPVIDPVITVNCGIPPYQTAIPYSIVGAPRHVHAREAGSAIQRSVGAWNAALRAAGSSAQFVKNQGAAPPGEVAVVFRFETNAGLFRGKGDAELAFAQIAVYRVANRALSTITYNDSDALAAAGGFSTDGAPTDTYDFEIITLHELGHVLGIKDLASSTLPPIMSGSLRSNKQLQAAGGAGPAALRQVSPQDQQLLAAALRESAERDVSGTYGGRLKVTKAEAGSSIPVGREVPVADFEVEAKAPDIVVSYRGGRVEGPAAAVLAITEYSARFHSAAPAPGSQLVSVMSSSR